MQEVDHNLSLALLRELQLHYLRYTVDTQHSMDNSTVSLHVLAHLFTSNTAIELDNRDIDNTHTCTTQHYTATLHTPAKAALTLSLKDARLLRSFLAAGDGGDGLQLLDDAIGAAVAGLRGRAADNTASAIRVRLWKHLSINDYSVEQQLFKAFVRSLHFEQPNARDATYVRVQYEDRGESVGGFARINYFFIFEGDHRLHMLANLDLIKVAKVAVTGGYIQNASAARGRSSVHGRSAVRGRSAARGSARGRGRGGTRGHSTMSAGPRSDALLFRIVPGRETMVVGIDAVVALVGIVYHGNDGYLVDRDSCFLP